MCMHHHQCHTHWRSEQDWEQCYKIAQGRQPNVAFILLYSERA